MDVTDQKKERKCHDPTHSTRRLLSPLKTAIPAQGGAIDIMIRVQGPEQPAGDKTKVTPKRLSMVAIRVCKVRSICTAGLMVIRAFLPAGAMIKT